MMYDISGDFVGDMKRRQNEYKELQLKTIQEKIRGLKLDILFLEKQAGEIKGETGICERVNENKCPHKKACCNTNCK